ncbi:hypothetical protein SDC9_196587 [bioreactor metagenome]|uniref:Uncharacterized protein n=1 Tax=bioreactor metagenome TaxID=1076179 RepID=A0A645IKY1_9ZZZZ
MVGDVGQAHETLIGHAEPHVGDASAGDVDGFETEVFDDFGRERVEGAGHEHAAAGFGQGFQGLAGGHEVSRG